MHRPVTKVSQQFSKISMSKIESTLYACNISYSELLVLSTWNILNMYDHRNVGTHIIVIELPAPRKKKITQVWRWSNPNSLRNALQEGSLASRKYLHKTYICLRFFIIYFSYHKTPPDPCPGWPGPLDEGSNTVHITGYICIWGSIA
jgi:hypothetical protein